MEAGKRNRLRPAENLDFVAVRNLREVRCYGGAG